MATTKYNVCVARKYNDRSSGTEKTHFWSVGKAFSFETAAGRKGINVNLYSKTIGVDEFVLFEDKGEERLAQAVRDRPNQQARDDGDDDIPF